MKANSHRRMFLGFFAAALVIRLAVAYATGKFHWLARSEVEMIGLNLAAFGRYDLYGGPTAHTTPLVPFFFAIVFKIFGGDVAAQMVNATLMCIISSVRSALVPLFALDAGFSRRFALFAGWLNVLYIGSVDTEVSGKLDGPFIGLALLILIWMAMRLWRDGAWQRRTAWEFFAFCGFCGLLNPSLFPVLAGLFVAGAVACLAALRKRYLLQTAISVASIAICLLPWAIRNQMALGAPIFTRSNFGLEFWISNGPGRSYDLQNNVGDQFHPSGHVEEMMKVAEMGEVAYYGQLLSEAKQWVRDYPGEFI